MKKEYEYAKQISLYIWAKCYKNESPDWKPLGNLMGVLSQIDNMVYGMNRSQSGKGEDLAPPPHNTWHAGPHQAFHRVYRAVAG
jgi:hypothetical protein